MANSDIDIFLEESNKKSPFIKFIDGEPVKGVFKGVKLVDDPFTAGQKTMEYTLECDEISKTFKSKSVKLASLIKGIKVGSDVQVVKTGTGMKTLWYVEEI